MNRAIEFLFLVILIIPIIKGQLQCYQVNLNQSQQQIKQLPLNQRDGNPVIVQTNYFGFEMLLGQDSDLNQLTFTFTEVFLTSNRNIISNQTIFYGNIVDPPYSIINQVKYILILVNYQQFMQNFQQSYSTLCGISQYSQLVQKEFVQVNSQNKQFIVSTVLSSQISDQATLTIQYPTSFASQSQTTSNLGCQLYTDYGNLNSCSFSTNSSSGLSIVSFDLTNLNFYQQNISASVILNYSTFNQQMLLKPQFKLTLLNQYSYAIGGTPTFSILDQRICQQTGFSSILSPSILKLNQQDKLQINFTPVSNNITRLIFEFNQQIIPKFNLTKIFITLADSSLTNSVITQCYKAYLTMIVCDLEFQLTFDITKSIYVILPYLQIPSLVTLNALTLSFKYFTDSNIQNCYATNFTLQYQAIVAQNPLSVLYNNGSLSITLFDTISLDNSMVINLSISNQLQFSVSSQLIQVSGISNLSQMTYKSQQSLQISQIAQQKSQQFAYGISFQLTQLSQSSIFCNFSNPYSVQIQIINSFGNLILTGSIPIQIQPYPITILSLNPIYMPNSDSQQMQNSSKISQQILEVNFLLSGNYIPQSSAFVFYLPPQLIRDSRISNVQVDILNQFNFYCQSQTNSTKIFSSSIQYDQNLQQRDTISVVCQFYGNTTFKDPQSIFTAKIQGYLLPKQVLKPTDRIIIDLIDFQQNSYQRTFQCQTSESLNNKPQLKNQWVFTNTQSSNFVQNLYFYQINTNSSNQSQANTSVISIINITTSNQIQDGDDIVVQFPKQQFLKYESNQLASSQYFSELKNLTCIAIFPQATLQTNFISCILSEVSSYFSIQLTIQPNQLSQIDWNKQDLVIQFTGVAFQPNLQNESSFIQFLHISNDNYLISQSNLSFTSNGQIITNIEYQVNKISFYQLQSLNDAIQYLKYDYIQLQFIGQVQIQQLNQVLTLNLAFSQPIYFNELSFCSIETDCSKQKQIVNCSLSQDGILLLVQQIQLYATCNSSALSNFNITIHNPEINNQNSTGGAAQSIAINWNLTSTTSSQTLLSGHTSLTTNTSQCPQPHCATCTSPPSICIHCTQGYYLLPDQNSCVQTCPPPTVAHQQTATCQPCFQHQECLQCQSQNPAACTSCSPTYSLNSTLLPYCYVPLPPSSSASSSVTKDVVNRTPSNSTFSGALNRPEPGQPSQKQQQQQQQQQQQEQQQQQQQQQEAQASDQRGFAHFLAQTKSYTKGFILTLLIPLSILGACLTRLVTFCLKKREKKVHPPLPSESRSAQIAQNLDERQETQKDGNGGDEEQMRASSRVDTANMCPLNSRRGEQLQLEGVQQQSDGGVGGGESEGNGYLAFCWIAVILLLGNVGDLVEVPYIIFSQQNSFSNKSTTNVFDLQFSEADMGQICCLSYIALNAVCYLICIVMMVKAIIFETGSGEPLFCIYEVKLSSSSSFCGEEMKKDKSEAAACKGDSNAQNENGEKHKKVLSGRKLWKLIIDVFLRCLVVVGGKAFCMVYSNVANVKGWLTCQVDKNLRAFRLFYMTLCIHAIFNMISAVFFTLMLTHFSFASWTAVAQDSLTSQGSDGGVEFSFFVDILAFKFLMSLICFLNCLHIQQLISACKSPNLPGPQNPVSHRLQSPSTPSSSASPADAVERDACKVSYFENTPNAAEKTTPTAVTLASYRQQETSGTGSQNLIEGRPRRKKPSKLSLLLKRDSGQKSGSSLSSRQQETPSPNLPSYSPNLYPSQAYI
uniref:MTB2p n=1 Tax=Tetrahymena thermophila TaxID=5911 RepID=M1JUD5_TETTH|nr:MTB2p [Tetrahymena thermophila]